MITPRRAPPAASDVARHYDELDRFYRELWGEHLHHGLFVERSDEPQRAAVRLVERVASMAGPLAGREVLDIGCGYGATAAHLAREHGARVTGVNVSEAQLRRARELARGDERLRFRQVDWMDNGLPDGAFDVVVAIESLAHMPDKRRFFREAQRILRPGGRIVVCAWTAAADAGRAGRTFLLEPICREGELPGLGTTAEYVALARAAGLQIRETQDLTRQVKRTWSISVRHLARALLRRPEYRRLLRDRQVRSRVFALAVVRIWIAYQVGAMRYVVIAGKRGGS